MTAAEQDLPSIARRLEAAYEAARERLTAEISRLDLPYTPEEMRDSAGRYVLLDALTALAQAHAAMVPFESLVVRPGDTLILRFGSGVSPEQIERARGWVTPMLEERMPGTDLVFVGGGVEQLAVYRPDDLAEAASD